MSGSGQRERRTSDTTKVSLPKKLIICCDGTWENSDNGYQSAGLFTKGHMENPTNVTRMARAIAAEDDGHHPQIVYYQAGVGTGMGITSQMVGGGTGMGLTEHIREAYAFLVNNYRENDPANLVPKDAIFLIGFSRGAFTARSISGLLADLGLLKKKAMTQYYEIVSDWHNAGDPNYKPLFFDDYARRNPHAPKVAPPDTLARDPHKVRAYLAEYRRLLLGLNLTQEIEIKCVGVWDTVGSLGVPVNPVIQRVFPFLPTFVHEYSWYDTALDPTIRNAFQALALDEHRYPFSPTLWEKRPGATTNLKQCWFPGSHSNIGGSYPDQGMADITLAWMMDQLAGNTTPHPGGFVHHDWIKFDEAYITAWYDSDIQYLTESKQLAYSGWALGHVYNSDTFPMSLLGKRVRSPGLYHRIFYESGQPDPKELLSDTQEFMHASVRVRVDLAGKGIEMDPSIGYLAGLWQSQSEPPTYQPTHAAGPLAKWRMVQSGDLRNAASGGASGQPQGLAKRVVWKYEGNEMCGLPGKQMEEDQLGPFEIMLLNKDKKLAREILFTNEAWQKAGKDGILEGLVHRARTALV